MLAILHLSTMEWIGGFLFLGLFFLAAWQTYVYWGRIPDHNAIAHKSWMTRTWEGGRHIFWLVITMAFLMSSIAFFIGI